MGCICKSKWKFWFFRISFITISNDCTRLVLLISQRSHHCVLVVNIFWPIKLSTNIFDQTCSPKWPKFSQRNGLRSHLTQVFFFVFQGPCNCTLHLTKPQLWHLQCYRQWLFKAPLCITLKIKIWMIAFFKLKKKNIYFKNIVASKLKSCIK